MKHKALIVLVLALAIALILPSSALAFSWRKSPTDPLVRGGVHSVSRFESLFLHSSKVQSAVKGVLKRDKMPSWVFSAALAQVKAGNVHSNSLAIGSRIGYMAFSPHTTKYASNTRWLGTGRLPYYYVVASQTTVQGNFKVTTNVVVALAKTCCNPFATMSVQKVKVSPPLPLFNLYIDKRQDSQNGTELAGFEMTGTVGGQSVDVTSTDEGPVLVGQFSEGTTYTVSELCKEGWHPTDPDGGSFVGTMPAGDVTLTFVNSKNKYKVYVDKRQCTPDGKRLKGWEITGWVGSDPIDVTTCADKCTLVGSYEWGTPYDLKECLKPGWCIVSPDGGEYQDVTPMHDITLVFVNKPCCIGEPPKPQ